MWIFLIIVLVLVNIFLFAFNYGAGNLNKEYDKMTDEFINKDKKNKEDGKRTDK